LGTRVEAVLAKVDSMLAEPERAELVARHTWVEIGLSALANLGWAIACQ